MKLAVGAWLVLAAGLLAVACGSSGAAGVAQDGAAVGASDDSEPAAALTLEMGSDVGQRIPDFYIRDSKFEKIESEELFASGRPVFFYFFTTW